jgi:hypothetical protein
MKIAMKAVLQEYAKEVGFPKEILILKNATFTEQTWRKMLSKGHLFIDTSFTGRGSSKTDMSDEMEGKHTEIAHLLQLLFVESRFQKAGWTKGYMRKLMSELFGSDVVADKLTIKKYHAWTWTFDALGEMKGQASRPEWFGVLAHIVANDIPYEEYSSSDNGPRYAPGDP